MLSPEEGEKEYNELNEEIILYKIIKFNVWQFKKK